MSEDVVYSEVVFVKRNKVDKDDPDECHLGDSSRAPQKAKQCCDWVRMVLLLLCILLTGALVALSFQCVYTEKKLEDLQQVHNVLNENLTAVLQDMLHCTQKLSKALYDSACPKNWEYHAGKCYLFSTNKLSWTDSRDACISDGGHLVIINSRDEQEFLIGIIKIEVSFWIGLTDEKLEGQWLWVDNTNLCKDKSYWTRKEPDNWKGHGGEYPSREDCAHIHKNSIQDLKSWFDAVCNKALRRICETRSSRQT
ncbi:immune-related, lectin-like receptor 4 [Onychostoma macrolepis]|uniref:C-type lectin domain-containing protein n=1 Tax=Onychostoma macrolepis TaxID=369639 RepID=A0A7J6C081_9TELE|nr:immune-related, lectin-like receptor 4 [Onychostoma macrolepis]KAF4100384.1 hypothetical protein G5714_018580 [Onychostoma macrolepis]